MQRRIPKPEPLGSARTLSGLAATSAALLIISLGVISPSAKAIEPRITLSDRIDIARMVDLAASELSVPIVYSSTVFGGQNRASPTFRLPGPITEQQLWTLLHQSLAEAGLSTVRLPGSQVLHVMTLTDARTNAVVQREVPASLDIGSPGFVRVRYTPIHISANELAARLTGLTAGRRGLSVQTIEVPNTSGEIWVGALTFDIHEFMSDVRRLDAPSPTTATRLYTPRHVDPVSLIARATEIAGSMSTGTTALTLGKLVSLAEDGRIMIVSPPERIDFWVQQLESIDLPGSRTPRLYRVENYPSDQVAALLRSLVIPPSTERAGTASLDIRVDTITDTLTIIASPREHEQIEAIINRIENAAPSESAGFWSRQIRYREADELLAKLRELVEAGVLDSSQPASGGSSAPGGRSTQTTGLSGISRVPDTSGGGESAAHSTVDAPARSRTQSRGGSDLRLASDQQTNRVLAIGDRRMISRLDGLVDELDVPLPQVQLELTVVSLNEGDSRNLAIELQSLTNAGDTIIRLSSLFGIGTPGLNDPGPLAGSGFSGVVLSPGDFGVLVRALETISLGQSVSRTTLLVANGEDARIDSAVQQPFLQTTVRSSESEITGFGGSVEAGLSVSVSPQIGPANTVRLRYDVELSAFIGSSAIPELPPPTQRNTVSSISTLPDGFTVAVGGFRLTDENEGESRVPILGEIPLLGELFKSSSRSRSDARFYVFIRPVVVRERSFDQLRDLSDSALRDAQLQPNPPLIDLPMMW